MMSGCKGKVGVFLLLWVAVALAGCAGPRGGLKGTPEVELYWPKKPLQPKIQWIKTVNDYQDVGITKGFWKRAMEFFVGPDQRHIVRPYGVFCDAKERLFIADPGAGVVHWMDVKQGRYTVIGEEGEHRLRTPIGIAEDGRERLYITDSTIGGVYRYDLTAHTLQAFPIRMLRRPTGIAYNPVNQLIYVVDSLANEVIAVDQQGGEIARFGASEHDEAQFNHPTDICIDGKGQIYVTDPLNYRIKAFTPEGRLLFQIGSAGDVLGNLNKPKGVAVDSEGHIYVADAMLDAVQVFDQQGQFLLAFGDSGTARGEFWMPSGLYVDQNDYLYVADTYNRRVQVFRYLGGKGPVRVETDTAAPAAR